MADNDPTVLPPPSPEHRRIAAAQIGEELRHCPTRQRCDQHQANCHARRQVQHMSRLVEDLLDLSRITRGRIELRVWEEPKDGMWVALIRFERQVEAQQERPRAGRGRAPAAARSSIIRGRNTTASTTSPLLSVRCS